LVEPGVDVDAAGMLASSVRRAVASGLSTQLATDDAQAVLRVRLLDVKASLQPMADPGMRAGQYEAKIRCDAALYDKDGELLWKSSAVTGEAPFLSPPGPIEQLDGARRRALARAADDAAQKLIANMLFARSDR
jgi:hypothetical protein